MHHLVNGGFLSLLDWFMQLISNAIDKTISEIMERLVASSYIDLGLPTCACLPVADILVLCATYRLPQCGAVVSIV
jgi:hypothetical protein